MKRFVVTFVGATAVLAGATAAMAAAPAAQAATTAAAPAAVALAVEGTNGAMYVQAPQLSPGWQSEGGQIIAPPAVVAAPNPDGTTPAPPLFIAPGAKKLLYIRSLTVGWQLLGPVSGSCLGSPAAVITGTALTVACEGTNHALYYNTATMPSSGLPQFTSGWTSLGGALTAGPAVAPVNGVLTFFVRGTNGHIYTRTLASGFTEMPWACVGRPAAALQASTAVTVFACEGTNHALWEATSTAGVWSGTTPLRGVLISGAAIAATSQQLEFFCEGKTHAVYERTLTTGWSTLGGSVVNGVGAAALN